MDVADLPVFAHDLVPIHSLDTDVLPEGIFFAELLPRFLFAGKAPDDFIRNRRRFVIREMKFNADWDTDPTSLPALVDQLKASIQDFSAREEKLESELRARSAAETRAYQRAVEEETAVQAGHRGRHWAS